VENISQAPSLVELFVHITQLETTDKKKFLLGFDIENTLLA
jgi:hypothetical protein